jgi:hypothetical protein
LRREQHLQTGESEKSTWINTRTSRRTFFSARTATCCRAARITNHIISSNHLFLPLIDNDCSGHYLIIVRNGGPDAPLP